MNKRSWDSNASRKSKNKYNCQTCKKEQEKARNLKKNRKLATSIMCYENHTFGGRKALA